MASFQEPQVPEAPEVFVEVILVVLEKFPVKERDLAGAKPILRKLAVMRLTAHLEQCSQITKLMQAQSTETHFLFH